MKKHNYRLLHTLTWHYKRIYSPTLSYPVGENVFHRQNLRQYGIKYSSRDRDATVGLLLLPFLCRFLGACGEKEKVDRPGHQGQDGARVEEELFLISSSLGRMWW